MPRLRWTLLASVLALAGLAGCESSEGFDLRIDVRTDYRPVFRFDSVRVRILEAPTDDAVRRSATTPAAADADYLTGVRVGSFSSLPEGRYLLDVALMNGASPIASRELEVELDQNTTVNAVMTASCAGLSCPGTADPSEATECVSGRCVAPDCTPETPEACPMAICGSDSECPAIGDCLSGRCVDGDCFQSPDDSACAAGTFCDATGSCEPVPVMTDMGTAPIADMYTPPLDGGPCACDGGEYCFASLFCAPRPQLTIQTSQGAGCVDLATPNTDPPATRTVISGRANATSTQFNRQVSCAGAPRTPAEVRTLDGTGRVEASLPLGSADCSNETHGRWDVEVEVDGQVSNTVEVVYFNSNCPGFRTCAQARSYCPPCRCDSSEYCFDERFCAPRPQLTIQTSQGAGCVDLATPNTAPPATRTVISGRANATSTQFNRQVSCAGAPRTPAEVRTLDGTGRAEASLPLGSADCSNETHGRWDVEVEVDGQVSNTVEVVYFNSNCPGFQTCSQARSYCP